MSEPSVEHVLWLNGFYDGLTEASWHAERAIEPFILEAYLSGDDKLAKRLRDIHNKIHQDFARGKAGKKGKIGR